MISTKKEIVETVKETLNPFFKDHGLGHDDFKTVAKTSTGKITNLPTTTAQIQLVVFETLSERRPVSVSEDGWSYLYSEMEKAQSEVISERKKNQQDAAVASENNNHNHRMKNSGNDNNNNQDDDGGEYHSGGGSGSSPLVSKYQIPGDEKITVRSFRNFLARVRTTKDGEGSSNGIAGQRRQRN